MSIAARTLPMTTTSGADRGRRILAIVGASSGNLVEWYDFYVYSFTALYFAGAFFPTGDRTTELLNAAGVFAAGFFMRPLGGWLFGWIADTRPPHRDDHLGADDVRGLADDRGHADLCRDRDGGAGAAALRAPGPRTFGRRRVRHQRNLYERGRRQGSPRLLRLVPIRHPDRRTAARARRAHPAAAVPLRRRAQGLGLARPVSHRRDRGDRRAVPAPLAGRDRVRGIDARQAGRDDPRRPASQARCAARAGIYGRRIAHLLHLHDLHAEISRQHRRDGHQDGERVDDAGPAGLHAVAAGLRHDLGPYRPQELDDLFLLVGGARDGAAADRARPRRQSVCGVRVGFAGPRHDQLLHLDQRPGESRAVPDRGARARSRALLCGRQRGVRRHRRIRRAVVQIGRAGIFVPLVRHRALRGGAPCVAVDARYAQARLSRGDTSAADVRLRVR